MMRISNVFLLFVLLVITALASVRAHENVVQPKGPLVVAQYGMRSGGENVMEETHTLRMLRRKEDGVVGTWLKDTERKMYRKILNFVIHAQFNEFKKNLGKWFFWDKKRHKKNPIDWFKESITANKKTSNGWFGGSKKKKDEKKLIGWSGGSEKKKDEKKPSRWFGWFGFKGLEKKKDEKKPIGWFGGAEEKKDEKKPNRWFEGMENEKKRNGWLVVADKTKDEKKPFDWEDRRNKRKRRKPVVRSWNRKNEDEKKPSGSTM